MAKYDKGEHVKFKYEGSSTYGDIVEVKDSMGFSGLATYVIDGGKKSKKDGVGTVEVDEEDIIG